MSSRNAPLVGVSQRSYALGRTTRNCGIEFYAKEVLRSGAHADAPGSRLRITPGSRFSAVPSAKGPSTESRRASALGLLFASRCQQAGEPARAALMLC